MLVPGLLVPGLLVPGLLVPGLLVPGPTSPKDQHWVHKPSAWMFGMAMLGALSLTYKRR